MAVADNVNNITVLGAGAVLIYQPAVGVEVIIHSLTSNAWLGAPPNGVPGVTPTLSNGVIFSFLTNAAGQPIYFSNLKILITNTVFLRIVNSGGIGAALGYSGVQIK